MRSWPAVRCGHTLAITKSINTCAEELGLQPGVYAADTGDGELWLWNWPRGEAFGPSCQWKRAVLHRLGRGGCRLAELRELVPHRDALDRFLDRLRAGGWLLTTVCQDGRRLYTVRPLRPTAAGAPDTAGEFRLSRFALLHRQGDDLVLQSPRASAEILVHDPAVLAVLFEPAGGALGGSAACRLLDDLRAAGLAASAGEEDDPGLRHWSPHELWFHERSRLDAEGRRGGFGRTWTTDRPPPARRTPYPGPAIDLYRPDLDLLRRHDLPLSAVLEDRPTRPHDDENPITVDQLGELLYRAARSRDGDGGTELELYPVAVRVSGLDPAMYHYDRYEHRLRRVCPPGPPVRRLIGAADQSVLGEAPPQALLIVSARFARLMVTHEQVAYAMILKDVGALYQTIYLVAASMGLAAEGLGTGDSDAFAAATGLDPTIESSVGDLILGTRTPH